MTPSCPYSWPAHFLAAIQTMYLEAGRETQTMLNATSLPPTPILARGLIYELDGIESPFILALDDFHIHETNAVHRA
jgi:ATP/maltotriose-dependent transcriptional regulator MalT